MMTPGPWWVEGNMKKTLLQVWGSTHGEGPRWIVNIEGEGPNGALPVTAEMEANARAIAALPELIEALEALADLYDTDEGCRSTPEYIAARAALLKAGVTR